MEICDIVRKKKIYWIFLIILNFTCAPVLFHRAPGFEQKNHQSLPEKVAVIQIFNFNHPQNLLYTPKTKAIELLKKAVEVSILIPENILKSSGQIRMNRS